MPSFVIAPSRHTSSRTRCLPHAITGTGGAGRGTTKLMPLPT